MAPTYNQQSGKTEIFHMPSADATVPDLMSKDRPSHPVLTIVKGPQTGETFELDSTHISLGRDPKNSVFLNDMTVSRHHAQIDLSNLGLNSLNGTWVDGAIINKATLQDGSTIQIGTFRMVFHTSKPRA